jgi:hypothetical protein
MTKVKLIRHTDENRSAIHTGAPELVVGETYTILKYHCATLARATLVEGYHNEQGGWWYDMKDFVVVHELNKKIKII